MHVQWLTPIWAWPLLVVAALACFFWARRAYAATIPAPTVRARRLLVTLRTLACLLALIAVARPLLVRLLSVRAEAILAVVVEDSGSMALRDQREGPDRWSTAWRLAATVDSLARTLDEPPRLVFLRGNGRQPLVRTDPASALADTPRAVGTDLPGLVIQARQQLLGQPLRGLVVLADGHSETGTRPATMAAVPLWLVGLGDPQGPPDRYLADLRYPEAVHRGEPLSVEVAVGQRQHGGSPAGEPVTIRLWHGEEVVAEQTAPLDDLGRWELEWTPQEIGLAVLTVEVTPLDNERFLANNRATLAVDVHKDRSRIAVLTPVPGWDVRFLAQAALRQPRLQLRIVRPGPEGPVLADSLQAWAPPRTAAGWLADWDAVVLSGSPGTLLPDGGASLAAAVRQGLGLCAIAGPTAVGDHGQLWPPALQEVLPATISAGPARAGEFVWEPAASAVQHPVLDGVTHGPGAVSDPGQRPPLPFLQPSRLRPGAEALLSVDREGLLLAAARPDQGRSLWFAGRGLWELAFWQLPARQAEALTPERRLLQQMLLWTALGDEAGGVALLGRKLVYEEGEPIPVAARWRDLRGEPVTSGSIAVTVEEVGGTGEVRKHPLRWDPTRPGFAQGSLPPLPPGRWRLTPQGEIDPLTVGTPREIVVTRAERERAQVRQDRRNLRQVAVRSGGTYLDANAAADRGRLVADLAALDLAPVTTTRQDRREPAAGWIWLAAVVGLLGAEWLLRRRQGLL